MPNLNVTYADMQSAASQLRSGESQIEGDRTAFLTALAYLGILTPAAAAPALRNRADRTQHEEARLEAVTSGWRTDGIHAVNHVRS